MARSIAAFSAARQVHCPGQVLQLQALGASDAHLLSEPLAEAVELGSWRASAVCHHGEEGPLEGQVEATSSGDLFDDLGDPEPCPERLERVDIPIGPSVDYLPARVLGHDLLRRGAAQDASGEPAQALGDLRVFATPTVVEDAGLGAAFIRVPGALGPSWRWVITEPSARFWRVSRKYMYATIHDQVDASQELLHIPCI
jgi:hypothetical protein